MWVYNTFKRESEADAILADYLHSQCSRLRQLLSMKEMLLVSLV